MNAAIAVTDVAAILDRVEFLPPKHFRNLLCVPIVLRDGEDEHPGRYTLFTVALERGSVRVEETRTVQSLRVDNALDEPVLAPAGTYLRGGAQDRTLTMSIVIPQRAGGEIPVHCVEQGRWNAWRGTAFTSSAESPMVASSVVSGSSVVDQETTWETVHDFARDTRTTSPSSCHAASFAQQADALGAYEQALVLDDAGDRVVGCAFFVRHPAAKAHWALDVFGRPDLFRSLFPALRRGAALTAVAAVARETREDWGLQNMSVGALHPLLEDARETALAVEPIQINRGALRTGTSRTGARVALLEDLGRPLHLLLRWTGAETI